MTLLSVWDYLLAVTITSCYVTISKQWAKSTTFVFLNYLSSFQGQEFSKGWARQFWPWEGDLSYGDMYYGCRPMMAGAEAIRSWSSWGLAKFLSHCVLEARVGFSLCGQVWASHWASLVAQMVKNLPAVWETWVQSLGWEDPLEEGTAAHSSILAWRIPWTEEPVGYSPCCCQE